MKNNTIIIVGFVLLSAALGLAVSPDRVVLAEDYTATWCSYCPKAGEALEELSTQFPGRIMIVAYHSDRLGDPFGFAEEIARGEARGVDALPAVFIDGSKVDLGDGTQELTELIKPAVESRITMAPPMTIKLEYKAGQAKIVLGNKSGKELLVNVYAAVVTPVAHSGKKDYPRVSRALVHKDGVQIMQKVKKSPKILLPLELNDEWWDANGKLDVVTWAEDGTTGEVLATAEQLLIKQ
jgi:thiol-disulfide isomerase/thioredoxin